jgi:parallel beta-helix repeat protein
LFGLHTPTGLQERASGSKSQEQQEEAGLPRKEGVVMLEHISDIPKARPATVFFALIAATLFSSRCPATTYYVSNDGSDSNAGTSVAAPLLTIGQAASRVTNNDTILLRRGDVFYQSVSFSRTGLTIDAYGDPNADLPVVSGGTAITGWTPYSDFIYVADCSANIGYLTVDGNHCDIARYPNRRAADPWLRTTSWTEENDGSNTVVTCTGLASHVPNTNDYWNGANMRWHRHSWWFETRPVIDYVASTRQLYLGDASIIHIMPYDMSGWGFFLDNKFEELDFPNEYYYDSVAGKVYLWVPGRDPNPNNHHVEASTRTDGLSVNSCTVRNIAFRHQKNDGLQITGNCTVENCRFTFIGSDSGGGGLNATWGVYNALVRNNHFENNYNAAISWNENPSSGSSSIIEHNTFINNGTVDGYGGEGPWKAMGIVIPNSTNLHFQHNYVNGTGYAGIIFGSNGNFAEYNIFINCMSTLNDGAAIYTNCSETTARFNIIKNTRGGMESSGPWANLAHGIWPEFLSEFRDNVLEYNTIINSGGFGIFLENNFDCVLRGNNIFGCDRAAMWLGENKSIYTPQGHIVEDNIFYADENVTSGGGRTLLFDIDGGIDYGTFANNYFCNPYATAHMTPARATWQWQSPITIPSWQAGYPSWADMSPKTDLEKFATEKLPGEPGYSNIFVNEEEVTQQIATGGVWRDLDGNLYYNCIELDAFTSEILVLTDLPNVNLNGDCVLDWQDVAAFADTWLLQTPDGGYNPDADFDGSGDIDAADYSIMAGQW